MKTVPTKSKLPMTLYYVTIGGEKFETMAYNSDAAISKCAFKYAQRMDDNVMLVQHNIKQGKLWVGVIEG